MQRAVSLTLTHPSQVPSTTFNYYLMEADFYYNMLCLIENIRVSFGNTYYQDWFIVHLQNATAIEVQICREQASPDPQDCHKYSNGMFIQHMYGIDHSIQRISSKLVCSIVTNEFIQWDLCYMSLMDKNCTIIVSF